MLAEPPPSPSLVETLRQSKELVFILAGIALAFTIHFGFGDFVQTESSTPTVRPVAANDVGNSERVRANAFERAEQRARRARIARRDRARAAAARTAAASTQRGSAASGQSTPQSVSTPASRQVSTPTPRPAPSKRSSSPASKGGGGGQSFDDSG